MIGELDAIRRRPMVDRWFSHIPSLREKARGAGIAALLGYSQ
jgi:hypothetical protein